MLPKQKPKLQSEKHQHSCSRGARDPPPPRLAKDKEGCCDVGRYNFGRTTVCGGSTYRRHKTVAAPRHSFDESGILRRVSYRVSQPLDGRIQAVVKVNEGVGWP